MDFIDWRLTEISMKVRKQEKSKLGTKGHTEKRRWQMKHKRYKIIFRHVFPLFFFFQLL